MLRTIKPPTYLCALLLAVLLGAFVNACAAKVAGGSTPDPFPSSTLAAATEPFAQAISSPTSTFTITPSPEPVRMVVPERWAGLAEQAIAALDSPDRWQLMVDDDPGQWLDRGVTDLALVPGDEGVPAGERVLALAVPFTSAWEDVSLEQAQEMRLEPSPFVAVLDWVDMTPKLKSLTVDGAHPGDAEYPLRQRWSVISVQGFEAEAAEIGSLIAGRLGFDAATHLVAVGDVMLDRRIGERIANGNPIFPFELVFDFLSTADVTVGNLECAMGEQGAPVDKGYTFRAPAEAARSFAIAGFDLLSLANNHAMDYGPEALLDAISLLEKNHVQSVGAGEDAAAAAAPVILTANGTNIAFLSYVDVPVEVRGFDARSWTATQNQPGVSWADPEQMRADIAAVRPLADIIVVLLHSGYEYVVQPSLPQVTAAHTAIDAGADLVLGHHAHVLQGIEFYNQGVIVYGLGNFVFDDGDIYQTALLNVWLDSGGVREIEVVPMMLTDEGRPRLATAEEADEILSMIYSETKGAALP
ncbi:MAG: CapA family protein [Anaerolineales bacterium]